MRADGLVNRVLAFSGGFLEEVRRIENDLFLQPVSFVVLKPDFLVIVLQPLLEDQC